MRKNNFNCFQMSIIRKAYPADFELIYPLLAQFDATGMTKERWSLLFKKYWTSEEEHIGFVLIDNEVAVGFIGCIFSTRIIENKKENFCGLSSWIVNPDYRSESILLLSEVLRLKNHTITSFTSIPDAVEILKKLKFKVLDSFYYWFPQKLNSFFPKRKINFITDSVKISSFLKGQDLKIFEDHIQFRANHIVLQCQSEYCYVVFKKSSIFRRKLINVRITYYLNRLSKSIAKHSFLDKEIFAAKIHYISNPELFNKYLPEFLKKISIEHNVKGIILDSRFYTKKAKTIKFKSMPQISLYKSNSLSLHQIDSLYTELFILDY